MDIFIVIHVTGILRANHKKLGITQAAISKNFVEIYLRCHIEKILNCS